MKLLLNDKEIAHFLYSLIDHHEVCNNIIFRETHTTEVVNWWISKADDKKFQKNIPKHKIKFKARLIKAIEEDLRTYTLEIKTLLNTRKAYYRKHLRTHIEYFINKIGEEKILNLYKNINEDYFVKSVGLHIDPTATLIRRKNFNSVTEDCLLTISISIKASYAKINLFYLVVVVANVCSILTLIFALFVEISVNNALLCNFWRLKPT
jgi:hypothetical protein